MKFYLKKRELQRVLTGRHLPLEEYIIVGHLKSRQSNSRTKLLEEL